MALTDAVARTTRSVVALTSSVILALVGVGLSAPSASANGVDPPVDCSSTFSGGAGSNSNPYLVSTKFDLRNLNGCDKFWGNSFLQTANIDMGDDDEWTTTTGTDPDGGGTAFSGTYDGNGFHISGLTIDLDGTDNIGLFGVVTGTIRNLGFIDSDLTTETVIANEVAGGLVGSLRGGTVSNSYATVYVFSETDYSGGLVGEALGGATIEDSYSTGSVKGDNDYIGGLVGGVFDATSSVRGSYSSANVTGGDIDGEGTGGLVGLLTEASIINSYATGDVLGDDSVGGLLGSNDDGTVSGVYATGDVTTSSGGQPSVAGLIGFNAGTVRDCYATGSATADDAAGLVSFNTGTITNCYSIGAVTGTSARGLVSVNLFGSVSNSFWDTETSDESSSTAGTGKTTSEMKTLTTFTDADWSITESCSSTTIWGLCSSRNSGYPYLTFYTAPPTPSDTIVPFSFLLPDGRECTSISPVSVAVGSQYRLPGTDALCGTMTSSQVIGWTIPSPIDYTGAGSASMPFAPGQLVRVVEGQRFTAVLWEPVLQLDFDANIATRDTCVQTKALHTSDDGRVAHVWVPREDIAMARFPASSSCVPEGYVLIGWNTAGDGSGEPYEPGAAVPEDWAEETANSHRLFAVWASSLS